MTDRSGDRRRENPKSDPRGEILITIAAPVAALGQVPALWTFHRLGGMATLVRQHLVLNRSFQFVSIRAQRIGWTDEIDRAQSVVQATRANNAFARSSAVSNSGNDQRALRGFRRHGSASEADGDQQRT